MAQLANARQRRMPPGPARRAEHNTILGFLGGLCLSALLGFTWIANAVVAHALEAWNKSELLEIHAYAKPDYDSIALGVTTIGGVAVIAMLGLIVIGAFLINGRRTDAITLAAVLGGGAVFVEAFKKLFHQARPALFHQLEPESSFSFPSGHSTLAFCFFGFLAVWLVLEGPRRVTHWLGALCCLVLALAIAASRLYLGVHWPSDVIAGGLIGAFWVSGCMVARQFALASTLAASPDPEVEA